MRQRANRGAFVGRTVRVPCAEATSGEPLKLDEGVDPNKGGWQRLFKGYGDEVRFNALPLTFLTGGKLVAQVIAIRAEGLDWWGMFVPEPAPATPEEADARFGADSKVGEVMRQITAAGVASVPTEGKAPAPAAPTRMNRARRREHEAKVRRDQRKAPAKAAR